MRACAIAASLPPLPPRAPPLPDRDLPTYTIIAPHYREASVAAQFVAALKALDYPAAKLEVKLVLELDDVETAAALRREGLRPNMEIVVAPIGAPRTKPRARNVALPLARGKLLAPSATPRTAPSRRPMRMRRSSLPIGWASGRVG